MNCKNCNREIIGRPKSARYCTDVCRNVAQAKRHGTAGLGLPTSTVGALSEMRIAADLLSRGFYTYRSLSPNSPCDIVAIKGNTILKIEVITGIKSRLKPGTLLTRHKDDTYIFDIMAIISNDGTIIEYQPSLP